MKRSWLLWMPVVVALVMTGCTGPAPVAQMQKQGSLKRIDKPKVSSNDPMYVGANTTGLELLRRISAEAREGNVIFSPVSLSSALAVLANGAAGDTRTEIDNLVNPERLSPPELNEKCCNLMNHLNNAGYSENGNRTTLLEMANSIWIQDRLPVKDAFLSTSNTYYGAEVFNVDFRSAGAKNAINRWIAEKTHGRIGEHITQTAPETVMYIFNSLYFRGKWQDQFDKSKTEKEDFHLGDGSRLRDGLAGGATVKVDMMNAERRIRYYEDGEIQAGEFNYYGCNMLVILPRGDLGEYLKRLDYARVERILDGMESVKTKIKFPRFSFGRKTRLNDHLKAAGMETAFDPEAADFTGISDRSDGFNLYVSDVSQECFISVDEEGTEAAALTSVGLAGSAPPKEVTPPEFYVNRPFLFLIRENRTGLILFAGKVENPLARE
ncbi:MAG: serpin family protein [Ignavibacteriales bacterium]